jgi:RimJ/RimL family protein N-acetyltransferase
MPGPISLADKPVLQGNLVTLRPVAASDAVFLGIDDPEAMRLTGSRRTYTPPQLEHWYATRGDLDDRLDLAIIDRGSGEYAGEVVLNDLVPENKSCNFRILLTGAQNRGRGLGTEATRLILAHAFETVGLHRVELAVYKFNPRARRVYDKVGFVYEGTMRDALLWDGEWVDADTMSILDREWAVHRGYPAPA